MARPVTVTVHLKITVDADLWQAGMAEAHPTVAQVRQDLRTFALHQLHRAALLEEADGTVELG